ncbi:hypothetical protein [Microlunatus parietis]|uniref:DUF4352 domain-containing protein n=1 Tax=Microlunatus parietis TaxID=682979 RepID=A0A7Y9I8K3_9ACTN|nr:hypothetical protein [Microlunatus parietis]NYE72303.1 hypothetical protein [Microlunatus parietis]
MSRTAATAAISRRTRVRWLTRRLVPTLTAGLLLFGASCTSTPPPSAPPSPAPSTPASSAPSSEDGFTFDDIAEFENGLTIEVAGTPLARNAGSHEKGAEETNGELIVVAVLISNGGTEPFPAQDSLITVQYKDVEDARLIVDDTGELQAGFSEPIPAGDDATVTLGFAVPFSALDQISVTVDPGDDVNEPVTFTGAAEREDEAG